jgi:hypothetical protein
MAASFPSVPSQTAAKLLDKQNTQKLPKNFKCRVDIPSKCFVAM